MVWKHCAEVGHVGRAVLKLNYPQLGIGRERFAYDVTDRNAVQNTLPVVDSICHSAQHITSSGQMAFLGPLVPALAHSMFLAAKLLMAFAGASMQGPGWPSKVQLLRSCLELFGKRWKVAGESLACARGKQKEERFGPLTPSAERYVQALNATFQAHSLQPTGSRG